MRRIRSYASIRTKVILIVAGTLILAIAVIAFFVRGLVSESIINNKRTTVEILTSSFVHDVKFDFDSQGHENVKNTIAKYVTYYRIIRQISFYDAQSVNIADSDREMLGTETDDQDIIAAIKMAKPSLNMTYPDRSNLGIRSIAPILKGSTIVGAVVLDVSINDVQTTISAINSRIALILILTVLIASGLLFILLRGFILRRISTLTAVTHQVAAGNYDIRVEDTRGDELGELADSFNTMTSDLRRSKDEIDRHNKHLEEMVREATKQANNAYDNLKSAQSQLILNEKMASLGVLIAGIAHEINTPVATILNLSRNLKRKIDLLPAALEGFGNDHQAHNPRAVALLQEFIRSARLPCGPLSSKKGKAIEALLEQNGIEDSRRVGGVLKKLNFTDPERIAEAVDCFRNFAFLSVADSIGSIAQAMSISETSSQKITEIVRALKYYAYTDQAKVGKIQINESIETALVLLRNRLKNTMRVTTDLSEDLPTIQCTSEIHQVWTNLLNNAYDGIREMGPDCSGEICVRTERSGDRIVVTVEDNGVGIEDNKIEKIFDPFFTTKDIGKGTGLGLSIVSGIIKKHHGTVRVQSKRSRTVFEISLPIDLRVKKNTEQEAAQPTSEPTLSVDSTR